jgi:uncharacterized protein (DUF305 family)
MFSKIKFLSVLALSALLASCGNNSSDTASESKDSTSSQSSNTAISDSSNNMNTNDNMGSANHMTAMNSMMDKMKGMKITGDFDIDFANMMIEHHQGAIDMSQQELNAGKDEKIKSMAQIIIDKQKKEVSDLQDFVNSYKPSGMKHGEGELQKSMSEMEGKMKGMQMSGDADKDFASMMTAHHQSAIDMARMELKNGMSNKLKQMAQKMIDDQNKEIKEFKTWLDSHK